MITITIYDAQWSYTFFYFLTVSIICIILITSLNLPSTFNWILWWQNGNSPFWSSKIYIIWCEFRKVNGFRYIFFHGYQWKIINLPKLQYKTEHLAKYQLNILCFYYKVWPTYVSLLQYRRKYISNTCMYMSLCGQIQLYIWQICLHSRWTVLLKTEMSWNEHIFYIFYPGMADI
jgi:hypothetical protein